MSIRTLLVAAIAGAFTISCTQTSPIATTRSSTRPATMPVALTPEKTLPEVERTAKQDLYWLADDAREGRGLGSKGLEESGDYIAARFKKLGLVPAASNGDFFEPFDFPAGDELGPNTRLAFNGNAVAKGSYTGLTNSKAAPAAGSLAFVGYGIRAADHQYDDYADIDVKGRVVLAMRWEPHNDQGKSAWDKRDYTSNAAINRKAEQAAKAGAAALIIVNAPNHAEKVDKLLDSRGGLRRKAALPVFHVDIDTANAMLAAAHSPTLAELQHQIDSTGKPASKLLDDVSVDSNIELVPVKNAARNVVAMLPGVGPHKDEYVVVGAHYDHVGRGLYGSRTPNAAGQIHNGADDNASGTTALMEIAEEFALAGRQDRSIIFASFTLEELGLIGSENFIKHLPVPKEKIVGMLNLDMVGRMRNEFLYVGGAGTADVYDNILTTAAARSPIQLKNMGKGGTGPSDHLSFSQAKIPVLFFYTGSHADYHTPTDDADKINYEGIAQVTMLAFDVVRGMCAMDVPKYNDHFDNIEPDVDVMAGEQPTTRKVGVVIRSRVSLGIEPDNSAEQSIKGVPINGIVPDSAAAAAGMLAGDIIVKLNERQIDNLYDLTGFLGDAKPGDVVKVNVLRSGKPMTFDVTLKPRSRQ